MIELTREILIKAKDYIPLSEKEAWVSATATKCFDRLAITANGDSLPPMYMLNTGLESRYLMTALASKYFGIEVKTEEEDPDCLMTVEAYDEWASSHVICQIDRWKHDKEVRDKCFEILEDYYDLRWRLTNQINGLLAAQNDGVMRQGLYMTEQMRELPQVIEQLKELQEKKDAESA